jgi:hypothetical protein
MVTLYLSVLKAPDVPRVFAAALLGRLSTAMGPLALVLYVQAATGSFAVAGAAAAATGLTSGLFAPVRGRPVVRQPGLAPADGPALHLHPGAARARLRPAALRGVADRAGRRGRRAGPAAGAAGEQRYVLVAELAPAGTMTEAATWVTTAKNVTGAAGTALAGVLVDRVGVPWTLAAAWGCAGVALVVALVGRAALVRAAPRDPQG